ncbi:MAG: hypothetical protein ACD_58C00225G0001, partial [uncultured bacterium]
MEDGQPIDTAVFNREVSLCISYFKELAGLTRRDTIDLRHYLRRQKTLEVLLERNPVLKAIAVEIMIKAGTLKPKPYLSWTVDRKASGNLERKVSGERNLDTQEARLGGDVIGWLKNLRAAKPA